MNVVDHTGAWKRVKRALVCDACYLLAEDCEHAREVVWLRVRYWWRSWVARRAEVRRLQAQVAKLKRELAVTQRQLAHQMALGRQPK